MAQSETYQILEEGNLVSVIADEDTITGFLLAGVGHIEPKLGKNFFKVTPQTPQSDIEKEFLKITSRPEVAILLITQDVADMIRHVLDEYTKLMPTILEIPSKKNAYDVNKDSLMKRILK
eukprot:CAMPEP_0174229152 /NCGR_PEP_ID=MMETSP0417-20130205/205_1 /TAXON_ID=242541 /ORGANISM="Mayorella sp, Strain BSH-02190019" /LENGTH=119 /DNA_ID=CAMNT_0015306671 /DNA_START=36 /DNA_END=392 /DNA_ORIENTATION=+